MSSLAGALIPPEFHPQALHKHEEKFVPDLKPQVAPGDQDAEMADLFGNDEAEGSETSDRLPSPERDRRRALEYEEEELPAELAVEVKEAQVSFPNIPLPRSSDNQHWVIRMPNFVKVDSKPFHPDTYVGPEEEGELQQQQGDAREKTMSIKLKVENTLRWRWTKDEMGNDFRQSNSRVIRWSDGTLSLRLGKELFDIHQSIDTSGAVPRQSFGGPQTPQPVTQATKSQGLTYLVAQHKRSQVLQAEALITGYMSIRPAGMQSETHRMLVRAVGQKHNKIARLRMAPDPTVDPEQVIKDLIKADAKKSKRKVHRQSTDEGVRPRKRSRRERGEYSDDEDDEIAIFGRPEDDDDDLGRSHSSRGARGKKPREDDDTKADYQQDGFVVADVSDEGDSDAGGDNTQDVMEDLEKMDAQIDAKQRRRRSGEPHHDEEMDVESEEEEEHKIRRTGRRRPVYEEEEEE